MSASALRVLLSGIHPPRKSSPSVGRDNSNADHSRGGSGALQIPTRTTSCAAVKFHSSDYVEASADDLPPALDYFGRIQASHCPASDHEKKPECQDSPFCGVSNVADDTRNVHNDNSKKNATKKKRKGSRHGPDSPTRHPSECADTSQSQNHGLTADLHLQKGISSQQLPNQDVKADPLVENYVAVATGRLGGHERVARALVALGAAVPTQVQDRAMHYILGGSNSIAKQPSSARSKDTKSDNTLDHRVSPADLIAVAPTGSGKTLCYAAPLCAFADNYRATLSDASSVVGGKVKRSNPRAVLTSLVLVPTRELAVQVCSVFQLLVEAAHLRLTVKVLASKAALSGLLDGRPDIIIATPQRAVVALERKVLDLGAIKHVVLDEADRLLDDGFIGQVDAVLAECGQERRIHSFSATMPGPTEEIIRGLCRDPVKIVVGGGSYGGSAAVSDAAKFIKQRFMFVGGRGEQGKVLAVRGMLKEGLMAPVLVFVQSKERAADLFRELIYDGVNVDAIHADRSGAARSSAIARFRGGELAVLIATDILARGLDFKAVSTVINYDFPTSAAAYVHRIGRTGRNGRHGTAITLFTEEDVELVRPVARVARASGCDDLPEWLLSLGSSRRDRDTGKRLERQPPKRRRVGGNSISELPKRHRRALVPGKDVGRKLRVSNGKGDGGGDSDEEVGLEDSDDEVERYEME